MLRHNFLSPMTSQLVSKTKVLLQLRIYLNAIPFLKYLSSIYELVRAKFKYRTCLL